MKRLITALALVLSTMLVYASPTGLLNVPTAEVVKMFKGGVVQATTQELYTSTVMNPIQGFGLEIGTDYNTNLDTQTENVVLNAKYVFDLNKLMKGTVGTPFSIGLGVMDMRDGYPASYYGVLRVALSPNIFFTGGYMNRTNSYDTTCRRTRRYSRPVVEEQDQWFIGAEMKVDEHLSLMIDYTDNAVATYNNTEAISTSVGIRYNWSVFSLEAGAYFVKDDEEDPQAVVKFSFMP